jgi:putative transposase
MSKKYKDKYRIESTRANWWDYAGKGAYFITMITKNRKHFFGRIEFGEMILGQMGKIAYEEWARTPEIRPDMNIELGAFVVMPDHFHAIIIINGKDSKHRVSTDDNGKDATYRVSKDAMHRISTKGLAPQSNNLASIIRGYKSSVTTKIKIAGQYDFAWQPNYYDHIIRDLIAMEKITMYIIKNPENWQPQKRDASRLQRRPRC